MAHLQHTGTLAVLTLLFGGRVIGQLIQYLAPTHRLPPFDAWQGSSLSYPVLLGIQVVILAACLFFMVAMAYGRLRPSPRKARWLFLLGSTYFSVMLLRLVLGLGPLNTSPWFNATLPAFFHLVLAAIVLTLAHYHADEWQRARFRHVIRWSSKRTPHT